MLSPVLDMMWTGESVLYYSDAGSCGDLASGLTTYTKCLRGVPSYDPRTQHFHCPQPRYPSRGGEDI